MPRSPERLREIVGRIAMTSESDDRIRSVVMSNCQRLKLKGQASRKIERVPKVFCSSLDIKFYTVCE